MEKIEELYKEWRLSQEEYECNTDCGEASVREDFESFIKLETGETVEVSFAEMLVLENNY